MSGGVGGSRRAIVVTRPDRRPAVPACSRSFQFVRWLGETGWKPILHCARASSRWGRGHVPLMPLSRHGWSSGNPTYNPTIVFQPGLARRAAPFQGAWCDGAVPGGCPGTSCLATIGLSLRDSDNVPPGREPSHRPLGSCVNVTSNIQCSS